MPQDGGSDGIGGKRASACRPFGSVRPPYAKNVGEFGRYRKTGTRRKPQQGRPLGKGQRCRNDSGGFARVDRIEKPAAQSAKFFVFWY